MKNIIYTIIIISAVSIIGIMHIPKISSGAFAPISVPAGGTGFSSTSPNSLLATGINATSSLIATSAPTVNFIIATSTTATSTFANGIALTGGCFSLNGTCLATGGTGITSLNGLTDSSQTFATSTGDAYVNLLISSSGTTHTFQIVASSTPTFTSLIATSSSATSYINGNLRVGNTLSLVNPLTVSNGGTGQSSFTGGQLLYGNSTAALSSVATTTVAASTGISLSANPGALVGGSNLTITNTGVISGSCTSPISCSGTNPLNISLGTVPVANGGTGSTTLGGILVGNGTSAISATGTVAVSNGGTGQQSFTAGQILFGNANGALLTSGNLYWDNANNRLGISSSTPGATLAVGGNLFVSGDIGAPTARVSNGYFDNLDANLFIQSVTDGNLLVNGTGSFGTTATTTISGDNATSTFVGGVSATGLAASAGLTLTGGAIVSQGAATSTFGGDIAMNGLSTRFGSVSNNLSLGNGIGTSTIYANVNGIGIGSTTPYATFVVTNASATPSFIVEDSASPDSSPFFINASGDVAIGTTSARVPLQVSSATSGSFPFSQIYLNSGTANSPAAISMRSTFLSTARTWFLGTGSAGSPNTNNFRIVDLGSGEAGPNIDVFNIEPGVPVNSLYIDSTGFIGFGTTSPNQKLTLFNNQADTALELSSQTGDAFKWTIGTDWSDMGKLKIASSTDPGTNSRLTINGAGLAGISTTSPNGMLAVENNTLYPTVYFSDSSQDETPFVIDTDGNVGIGSSTPKYRASLDNDSIGTIRMATTSVGQTFFGTTLVQTGTTTVNGSKTINWTDYGLRAYTNPPIVQITLEYNNDAATAVWCNPHTITASSMIVECISVTEVAGALTGASIVNDATNRTIHYTLTGN